MVIPGERSSNLALLDEQKFVKISFYQKKKERERKKEKEKRGKELERICKTFQSAKVRCTNSIDRTKCRLVVCHENAGIGWSPSRG